jgi:sulfate transport system permease protein
MPGLGLTLGITLSVLGLVVMLPLAAMLARAAGTGWDAGLALLTGPRALAAFRVSFGAAALAALANVPIGVLLAWVLTRYDVPGRRLLDALVDLPFALPTAVAGIALTALYADDGWAGALLAPLGIQVAYTPAGIWVALLFVGLPFVVRTVQPVLAGLDRAQEEAAMVLDASALQVFRLVVLPPLWPAVLTGAALALARGVGEYGSVIFIAGNRPGLSEIVPLLIVIRLEGFDIPGAALLGAAMLVLSVLLLVLIQALDRWNRAR